MSGYDVPKENQEQREERFRYVDKTHPLMKVLFNLGLIESEEETSE